MRTSAPMRSSMSTRTDDCICHEQVSTMRPAKRSAAQASTSSAERSSISSERMRKSCRETASVDTARHYQRNADRSDKGRR